MRYCRTAKQRLWVGPGRYTSGSRGADSDAHTYTYSHAKSYGNGDANTDSNCDTNADSYANTDANGDAHTYPDAWRDHAQCACAQGAGQAHGGSHLERVECGHYRHLP